MNPPRWLIVASVLVAGVPSTVRAQDTAPSPPEASPATAPASRLIFGPTARMPAVGGGHLVGFQAYSLTMAQVGLTPRVAINIGAPITPVICGCGAAIVVAPKVQVVNHGRTTVATGLVHLWQFEGGYGGYGYVVATHGTKDAAVTVGTGALYAAGGETKPLVSFGAERRLGSRGVWVTENYFSADGVMTSGGFRVHGTHWSVDLALGWLIHDGSVLPLPFVNVTRSF